MPVITRRPKTAQTTPKVTARPLLEELMEAVLGFGIIEVEEGRGDDEEVDDDDDAGMSFASRAVYLENFKLSESWKMLREVHTPKYLRLQMLDLALLILQVYASYSQDRFDSK
jgi:hypothetical protein